MAACADGFGESDFHRVLTERREAAEEFLRDPSTAQWDGYDQCARLLSGADRSREGIVCGGRGDIAETAVSGGLQSRRLHSGQRWTPYWRDMGLVLNLLCYPLARSRCRLWRLERAGLEAAISVVLSLMLLNYRRKGHIWHGLRA